MTEKLESKTWRDDCEFELLGNKLHLESRTRNRFNSKGVAPKSSRPSSAIPRLGIHSATSENQAIHGFSDRPVSADCILYMDKTSQSKIPDRMKNIRASDNAQMSKNICPLTPGIVGKPPLPQKCVDTNCSTNKNNLCGDNASAKIHQHAKSNDFCIEEVPVEAEYDDGANVGIIHYLPEKTEEEECETNNFLSKDPTNYSENCVSADDLKREIFAKECQTDKCLNTIKNQCQLDEKVNSFDFPNISEIDIEKLFTSYGNGEAVENDKGGQDTFRDKCLCNNNSIVKNNIYDITNNQDKSFCQEPTRTEHGKQDAWDNQGKTNHKVSSDCKTKRSLYDVHCNERQVPPRREETRDIKTELQNKKYEDNAVDELVSIIEVLENENKKTERCKNSDTVSARLSNNVKEQEPLNFSAPAECDDPDQFYLNNNRVSATTNIVRGVASSEFSNLWNFLEENDRNCKRSLNEAKERIESASKLVEQSVQLNIMMEPKIQDLLVYTKQELASQIVDLTIRLKDKTSSIRLLQNELSSLREQIFQANKNADQLLRQKLKQQKQEYEGVTNRHQKFIDQLMVDKKMLQKQCEGLLSEMKTLEERHSANMKAMEHRHQVEIQRVRDMQSVAEKIRRERWLEGKTKKIKELTVRSIEPEIESMEKRQQEALADLRALHKKEIEDLELKAAKKLMQQLENLRDQLTQEREKAISHERDVMRQRYEKLVESEEKGYQEQRRRLLAEHANRMAELEERETANQTEKERQIKQIQEDYEQKLQVVIRRHASEIKVIKDSAALEMENWKVEYKKQQSNFIHEREAALKKQFRKERDSEIEKVIERLETESNKAKQHLEEATENRIRRLKEKYENEIKDLENMEQKTKSKYVETKKKLLESEETVISLRASIKHLEIQLSEAKQTADSLTAEREQVKNLMKEELEKDFKSLECQLEMLKAARDKEIEQIHSRVKLSISKKDDIIFDLEKDNKSLQEKCIYLQNMVDQQRKDYLLK